MASRRVTTRSSSGNGRSIGGSGRPGGCSYLSNVRPENRSTLCSVIAHLAEETQPSFETTLKSSAVSGGCAVTFCCVVTGHPTPQVIWYKDDAQLDRFCGLPKYEIFHSGQSHSLHIYNCTVEDAAIYQASASNVKGIVSCSGVLEVGEMNEFKIHQRYFAKLKQKAEHRRREAEGKENLQPLRPVSPERSPRKRRSATEAVPSSPRAEDVPVEPGAGRPACAGGANAGGMHTHDSTGKVLAAHRPRTASVKKKIKICNGANVDSAGETAPEEGPTTEESPSGGGRLAAVQTDAGHVTGKQPEAAGDAPSRGEELTSAGAQAKPAAGGRHAETAGASTPRSQEDAGKTGAVAVTDGGETRRRVRGQPSEREASQRPGETTRTDAAVGPEPPRPREAAAGDSHICCVRSGAPVETAAERKDVGGDGVAPSRRTEAETRPEPSAAGPASKVVSVAGLLRAQLKARESTLTNPDVRASTGTGTHQQSEQDHRKCRPEEEKKKSRTGGKTAGGTNLEATPVEISHHLNTDSGTEPVQPAQNLPPHASTRVPRVGSPVDEMEEVDLTLPPSASTDEPTGTREVGVVLGHAKHEPVHLKNTEPVPRSTPGIKLNGGLDETSSTTLGDHSGSSSQSGRMTEKSQVPAERNCASPTASASPQELASGARRKVPAPWTRPGGAAEPTSAQNSRGSTSPASRSASPDPRQRSPVLQPPSPERKRQDPFKAPQVIRKIRSETFGDASGHLKLWCQFFNVLSDSTVQWYRNGEEIARMSRKAGDESRVNLAIVQASCRDSGVYRCSITNDHGTDSTELLLSADVLAGLSLCEDLGVGEEIELMPLIFSKGVADAGAWGNRLFGRVMMQESRIGEGCSHKVWRAKVIYGLAPVFESGDTCVIKAPNPISYGGREDGGLVDGNLEIAKQRCRIQNLAREYCKVFSAEARLAESFGPCLEVIPVYLLCRPANPVPYATAEAELTGPYRRHSLLDPAGRADPRSGSWLEQKCCALQHWIHRWTNGNLLLTRLEGVDTKITNVGVSVKATGHQGLSIEGDPKAFELFVSQHRCNYFCGLLGLRSPKVTDSLAAPSKPKASRSPLLRRKAAAAGSSSPRSSSPRLSRKAEQEGAKTPTKPKAADAPKTV